MMMRMNTQGAKTFEQQVYMPKNRLLAFLFLFSFPAFNNQKCDLAGLKNMIHLVLWLWVSFAWLWREPCISDHNLNLEYSARVFWQSENLCLWLYSCWYYENVVIVFIVVNDYDNLYDNLKTKLNEILSLRFFIYWELSFFMHN